MPMSPPTLHAMARICMPPRLAPTMKPPSPTGSVRAGRSRPRGFITYPTNYLLAVADTTTQAASAVAALSSAGFPAAEVVVMAGPEAGEEFGRLGPKKGPLSQLVRLIQFTTMDQMPDFRVYEDALLDERTIVGVRVSDADRILGDHRELEGHHRARRATGFSRPAL